MIKMADVKVNFRSLRCGTQFLLFELQIVKELLQADLLIDSTLEYDVFEILVCRARELQCSRAHSFMFFVFDIHAKKVFGRMEIENKLASIIVGLSWSELPVVLCRLCISGSQNTVLGCLFSMTGESRFELGIDDFFKFWELAIKCPHFQSFQVIHAHKNSTGLQILQNYFPGLAVAPINPSRLSSTGHDAVCCLLLLLMCVQSQSTGDNVFSAIGEFFQCREIDQRLSNCTKKVQCDKKKKNWTYFVQFDKY